VEDGSSLKVFPYEDGEMFLPAHAHISLGFVNEKGIWSINFSKCVDDIINHYGPEATSPEHEDTERQDCTSSEFEILCMF